MSAKRKMARQQAAGAVVKAAEKAESAVGAEGVLDDYKHAAARQGMKGVAQEAAEEGNAGHRDGAGFWDDERAQATNGAQGAVNLVVALVVGGLMAAFLLPIAINEISSVDTTSWDGGAAALWNILPVMIVLAVFLFFVGVALKKSGRL